MIPRWTAPAVILPELPPVANMGRFCSCKSLRRCCSAFKLREMHWSRGGEEDVESLSQI